MEIQQAWQVVKRVLLMVNGRKRRLLARETQMVNLKGTEDILVVLGMSEMLCGAPWLLVGWAGGLKI